MAMLMVMLMVNLAKCDANGDLTNGDAVHINILACIWLKGRQKMALKRKGDVFTYKSLSYQFLVHFFSSKTLLIRFKGV